MLTLEGGELQNAARYGQGRRAALFDHAEIHPVLGCVHAAGAGADDRGGARSERLVSREAGLRHRLVGRRQQILRDGIAEGQQAFLEMGGGVEALHLRRDFDAAAIGPVELGFADAGTPVARGAPEGIGSDPRRRHGAHAGDDDPAR